MLPLLLLFEYTCTGHPDLLEYEDHGVRKHKVDHLVNQPSHQAALQPPPGSGACTYASACSLGDESPTSDLAHAIMCAWPGACSDGNGSQAIVTSIVLHVQPCLHGLTHATLAMRVRPSSFPSPCTCNHALCMAVHNRPIACCKNGVPALATLMLCPGTEAGVELDFDKPN